MFPKFPRILLLAAAALCSSAAHADDDFGIWTSLSAEKNFSKRFSAEAGLDFRAEQKFKSVARWGASVGASYKTFKFLRFGVGYAYLYDRSSLEEKVNYNKEGERKGYNVDAGFWRSKHRGLFEMTAKHKIGRFTFSLRERYQLTHYMGTDCKRLKLRDRVPEGFEGNLPTYTVGDARWFIDEVGTDHKGSKNSHYLRSRFEVEYDIKGCPITPSVGYELSNNLQQGFSTDKTRLTLGAQWKITKKHSLSLSYIFQDGMDDDDDGDIHVIDLGYKFKF